MFNLENGCAVITGAASGLGRATAVAFARSGSMKILLGDLSLNGLEETRQFIRKSHPEAKVEISALDTTDEASVEQFFAIAVATYGRIDFAANVAGYAHVACPIVEMSIEEYDKTYAVNQRGTFLCQRALLRQMLKQEPLEGFDVRGSIVNVTSVSATMPIEGQAAYSASVGGQLGMNKTDALDYGPDKIRVNSVAPGTVSTLMNDSAWGLDSSWVEATASMTPLRRCGRPEEVANAIVWLSSPLASFITGISLTVDGGLSLATAPQ